MRRCWILAVLLAILCLPVAGVSAEEEKAEKYVALTFDDGPSGHFTRDLLDGLAEREIRATFFLCGYRVEQFPNLAARIAQEGHEIGSHSDRHSFFSSLSPAEVCADLHAAREKILAATGQEPTLLRPPGGIYDAAVIAKTDCADLPLILWSVDPSDWCRSDAAGIVRDVTGNVRSGDVILLHDMSDSSVQAALTIIDELGAQGWEFVKVSELAKLSGTELQGGAAYYRFSPAK